MNWVEMILPVALFWFLPELKASRLSLIKSRIEGRSLELEKVDRIRNNVSARMEEMSRALYKLGHSVEKQIKAPTDEKEEAGMVIEQLTQQVCSCCNKSSTCWETRLFYTCKVFGELVDSLQKENANPRNEAEREFNRFCVHPGLVIETLLRIIEIKRVDKIWKQAVMESQSIIPEQIYYLSEILSKLSGEVFQDVEYFGAEEKKIAAMLRKKGFPVVQTR